MFSFKAIIEIIGVNPYVLPPEKVLNKIFKQADKNKGPIPVRGTLDGHPFIQTLVKYSGKWRLYLNMPMRKAANKDVGDRMEVKIEFDPVERVVPMHPKLADALKNNKNALNVFESMPPSMRKEIVRYICFLKTEESVDKNVLKAIQFLLGKGRFVGRDKP
ncbi:MAG: YdeI/OmpD-associated family protein [Bacteroidota bacterium]